ncbi:MAG TPA: outer membrane beta-barrel protein [Casimicrobiaceae bacterium]|nr:outer membrane beta-barrel protein [Casimicrobiaceae bacterium]
MAQRLALVLGLGAWATMACAQAPSTPGAPERPPAKASTDAPPGAGLLPANPASPLPDPDLASSAAFPARRGFVRAEPFLLYPTLGAGIGYNDNLTGEPGKPLDSPLLLIAPQLVAETKSGGHAFSATYSGSYGHYTSSSDNDFDDHAFVLASSSQFTARADLDATAFYLIDHDVAGSVSRAYRGTPDVWHAAGVDATFGYGARDAQGRIEAQAGVTDKRYKTNLEVTEAFDVRTWNAAARFFYRVAPLTRLLAELRYTDYDYTQQGSPLDSSETRLTLGATWEATAATRGIVKVGYVAKRFRDDAVDDYGGPTFEAAVRWLPLTYSRVEAIASYAPVDTTGSGLYSLDTAFAIRWVHDWKSYLQTRVVASYVKSDYEGVDRKDHVARIGVGGFFDARTWLRFGLEFAHENHGSTDPAFDFTRNLVLLTVAGTI